MSLLSSIHRKFVSAATEVVERYVETVQFAVAVAIAFIVFHGLEGLLGIAGAGLLVRSIAFGAYFAVVVVGSLVAMETVARQNSLARRTGRWLRRSSAPVRERVVGAWRALANTKRALIELGVDVGLLVFGLAGWALQCVAYGAVLWLLSHGLGQIGVNWITLSLAQYAYAGALIALFGETLTDRVDDIVDQFTTAISAPARIYLRRVKAEWLRERARSADRSSEMS
jgi:hypothetical protein